MMQIFLPIVAAVFLWWFTTGLVMAVYGRGLALKRAFFAGLTVVMLGALVGTYLLRGEFGLIYVYLSVTCGVLCWAWQVGGYYLGFVTGGQPVPERTDKLTLWGRFMAALRFSLHHELIAVGLGLLLAVLTAGQPNRWAFWIYAALWVMHASAKLNVFLGVRNFRIDLLPQNFRKVEGLLGKRPHNELFPFSVLGGSTAAVLLGYYAIMPGTPADHTAGYLLVGTMIALGVIEHWLLVLPLPAIVWGWGLQPVTPQGIQAATHAEAPVHMVAAPSVKKTPKRTKRVLTYEREHGPFVVDVWEPKEAHPVPPILLIHGWGGTGNYWHQTAFDLSKTARVIVPDLPGTGRSQPVNTAQDMFDQIEALKFTVDELMPEEPIQVVGHSMGGAMAILLADAYPQHVERVVLTSLCFFMNESQKRAFGASMFIFKATMGLRKEWLAEVPGMPQLMALQYFHKVPNDPDVLRQGLLDYLRLDSGTTVACADDSTDPRIPEAGARLQAPTLLIACRQDRVMPTQNVAYTASVIPNCEVAWIDECGHLPMVEKTDEYLHLLHGFLRTTQ